MLDTVYVPCDKTCGAKAYGFCKILNEVPSDCPFQTERVLASDADNDCRTQSIIWGLSELGKSSTEIAKRTGVKYSRVKLVVQACKKAREGCG